MSIQFQCRYQYRDGFEVNARFEAGDGVTAICGPSGSGKTTILMLIAGLLRPTQGRIVLGNRILVDTASRMWTPPHRRAVGVVFQDSLLFPHRSVRDNLKFGWKRSRSRQIGFEQVVTVLELGDLLDRRPSTLSGGQARRVAIGRALLRGPELLILDEPWVGLDEPLRERVAVLVQRCVAEWRIPTLLVSHDQPFVRSMTSHIIMVHNGNIRTSQEDVS